ncbi:MAG: hypothetical protein LBD10_07015 [Desulfobulbus sp.]|jgi:quinol monooxygenase YgiN|uniref:putative quinol monooxygenase n=1 Tax=Desulfobulbus sp. TaxID=895 RepID=UPI0028432DDB|nr:hypothetical protein [Desulfobulbus sp.]MDR2549930.1 hypothetical protein [Desulfobulbus sp.]
MFLSRLIIHPYPGEEAGLLEVLDSIRGLVAVNIDCLECRLTMEVERETICYTERWRSWEALEQHLRSPLYSRVLEAMEMSRTPPEITFFAVQTIGGLEVVERARLHTATLRENEPSGQLDHS